jgi:methionine-rich copper-binding protein CopC
MGAHAVRGWLVGILAMLSLLLIVSPVRAHAELDSSDPSDGASLTSAPDVLSFTFGEQVLEQGNAVTLTDVASGSRLEVGPVQVEGDMVSVSWPEQSPAGQFRAAYRVVSADGHPIEGSITFTVDEAVGAAVASPVAASTSDEPSALPAASASAVPAVEGSAPAEDADAGGGGALVWILALGVAAVIGAAAGMWVMRKTR